MSHSHTISVHDVKVGQRWRNKKSGITATVGQLKDDCALLVREKRASTWKWLDLLVIDYELLPDDEVTRG